jgi:hypothetical protein
VTGKKRGQKGSKEGGRRVWLLVGAVALAGGLALGFSFWPAGPGNVRHAHALAPESALPDNIRKAPLGVRDAYRFAIANRDILRQIPCYCGCGAEHQSNAECYIKDVRPNGEIVFDPMSFG